MELHKVQGPSLWYTSLKAWSDLFTYSAGERGPHSFCVSFFREAADGRCWWRSRWGRCVWDSKCGKTQGVVRCRYVTFGVKSSGLWQQCPHFDLVYSCKKRTMDVCDALGGTGLVCGRRVCFIFTHATCPTSSTPPHRPLTWHPLVGFKFTIWNIFAFTALFLLWNMALI